MDHSYSPLLKKADVFVGWGVRDRHHRGMRHADVTRKEVLQLPSFPILQELEELMGKKIADRENLKPEEKAIPERCTRNATMTSRMGWVPPFGPGAIEASWSLRSWKLERTWAESVEWSGGFASKHFRVRFFLVLPGSTCFYLVLPFRFWSVSVAGSLRDVRASLHLESMKVDESRKSTVAKLLLTFWVSRLQNLECQGST